MSLVKMTLILCATAVVSISAQAQSWTTGIRAGKKEIIDMPRAARIGAEKSRDPNYGLPVQGMLKDDNRIIDQPKTLMIASEKARGPVIDQPKVASVMGAIDAGIAGLPKGGLIQKRLKENNVVIDQPKTLMNASEKARGPVIDQPKVAKIAADKARDPLIDLPIQQSEADKTPVKGVIHLKDKITDQEPAKSPQDALGELPPKSIWLETAVATLNSLGDNVRIEEKTLLGTYAVAGTALVLTAIAVATTKNPAYAYSFVIPPVEFSADENSYKVPKAPRGYTVEDAMALSRELDGFSQKEIDSLVEQGEIDAALAEYAEKVGMGIHKQMLEDYQQTCTNPNLCS